MADILAAIAALSGDEGWWHTSGQEELEKVAAELVEAGLDAEAVIDILSRVFQAAAAEYGD